MPHIDADSRLTWRHLVVPLALGAVPWRAALLDDPAAGPGGTGLAVVIAMVAAGVITALAARFEGPAGGPVWRTHARQAVGLYVWALVGAVMQFDGWTALGQVVLPAACAAIAMNLTIVDQHRRAPV